jgi:hypothetical protein
MFCNLPYVYLSTVFSFYKCLGIVYSKSQLPIELAKEKQRKIEVGTTCGSEPLYDAALAPALTYCIQYICRRSQFAA